MPFPFHIDIIDLVLKGILIGIFASAPMGPVGILCVQRTLNKGRWYGFVTGIGAAVSDIIYALFTGLGMSFVMNLITNPHHKYWLQISSSVMLLIFGLYCFRSNPTRNIHSSSKSKGSLWHNGLTAFFVTFSNPLIIFIFMFLFALLTFVIPNHPFEMCIGFISIMAGALLWWFGLTWLIDKIRNKFDNNGILIINKVIGGVVIIFSIVFLIGTIFNLYHIPGL
ncbi:translocator protein, LysE family [Prevotella sp. DNF00663]|uniref:LysE family translocator n=1 Tax=unclassified Prevotella TaxID=2638335 RepID=UPI00051439D1|nr:MULTISPECIES: LysE family transporter [unclassified Prevotella]KGI59583.1 LysE family translocator protein [Prevotella sp. S7 MS 2]KXB84585.1 translocator protein, LysE family [Prevotella sp. DNF00663]